MVKLSKTTLVTLGVLFGLVLTAFIVVGTLAGMKIFPGQEIVDRNADVDSKPAAIVGRVSSASRNITSSTQFPSVFQNISTNHRSSGQNSAELMSTMSFNLPESQPRQSPHVNLPDDFRQQAGRAILRGEALRNLKKGIPSKNGEFFVIPGSPQDVRIAPCPSASAACAAFRVANSRPLRCTAHDQCAEDQNCCFLDCYKVNTCLPRIAL